MSQASATLQVTVDKSHIATIGEKLYGESLELIRELVSNAYDADATRVWITLEIDSIQVRDDGVGMDEAGLREYFNIGSANKKHNPITPRYKRQKIGQFGIGKFAVLSACNRFKIHSQKGDYAAEVTFDRREWQNNTEWRVPIQGKSVNPLLGDGILVRLEELKRTFSIPEVERFLRERFPLNAPHFEIHLNTKKVEPALLAGRRFIVNHETPFGRIEGELIAPNFRNHLSPQKSGIEVTVNRVIIKKETFDLEEQTFFALHRLTGRVAADFLPITSDRSRFITDTPEYRCFLEAMQRLIRKVGKELQEQSTLKNKQKADQTLKETMSRLGKAIRRNPAFAPKVLSPTGEIDETGAEHNALAPESDGDDMERNDDGILEALKLNLDGHDILSPEGAEPFKKFDEQFNENRELKVRKVKVKNLAGKMMVARRIKIGGLGMVCNIESYGKNEKPVFTESGIICINQDHPLYQKQARRGGDSLSFYLAYLLSQQIALLVAEEDPHRAFAIQNKLLSDSF